MANEKKQYLSESIDTELEWIKDISDRTTRSRFRALDLEIIITYTYFVYHYYSVEQLARINDTSEQQIITWILIAAYIINGGSDDLGTGHELVDFQRRMLLHTYPKAKGTLPCHRCVWADTRTGRVICFRRCKNFNCFQSTLNRSRIGNCIGTYNDKNT